MMLKKSLRQITIGKRAIRAKAISYMNGPTIDPNTRLYVPFSEGIGSVAKDYSQYGNHAVLTDVEWGIGLNGNAGVFNGVSSYGDCGNHASLNITDAIMTEAWLNIASFTFDRDIISKFNPSINLGYLLMFSSSNNTLRFYSGGSVASNGATTSSGVVQDTWMHVVGLYDRTDTKIYINGEWKDDAITPLAPVPCSTDLFLGQRSGGTGRFNGTINEVIIKALAESAAQIAADCYEVCT